MHLTPEQIDRQPFRMTRRGYDIVEVREFLREIATEMRERQQVRSRLVREGDSNAVGEAQANEIVDDAKRRAGAILASAKQEAGSVEARANAQARADGIIAAAEREATAMIEGAEDRARQRADIVIGDAQLRLNHILAREKEARERLEVLGEAEFANQQQAIAGASTQAAPPTSSFGDFMKTTLRHEVHPD